MEGVSAETDDELGQGGSAQQSLAAGRLPGASANGSGPPALMCAAACLTVLALAGYRADGDGAVGVETSFLPEIAASESAVCEPADVVCAGFEGSEWITLAAAVSAAPEAGSWLVAAQPPEPGTRIASAQALRSGDERDELHTVPHLREVLHRIRKGETLYQVLKAGGVPRHEVGAWVRAADEHYDLDRVYAGQAVSYLIDMQSRNLRQLAIEIDKSDMLVAEWEGAKVVVRRQTIPVERRLRITTGAVRADFAAAARLVGTPEPVFAQVADVLGWELNLDQDIAPGARFRIAYEERTRGASEPTYHLLAVQVEGASAWHEAYYFAGRGRRTAGYYDRRGRTIGARFLRYPVEYTRISSRFAERRFHPVLRIPRPHYGVDFAAPTGTPVRAVADGVVLRAGWYGANGRFVKLRHAGTFATGYAHLARVAPGIEPGTRVRKGQTIGYVGSSGMASGPHLHFAMYRNGRYVDPFEVELPRGRALARGRLRDFRLARTRIERALMDADPVEQEPIVTASAKF